MEVSLPPEPCPGTAPAQQSEELIEPTVDPAADDQPAAGGPLEVGGLAESEPRQAGRGRAAALIGAVVLAGVLWSLLLSFPFFGYGSQSYVVIGDTANITLPDRLWYPARGISPFSGLWNPQGESGSDRLAGGLSKDADMLPFAFLPGWLAYGLIMWVQRAIAILAMYVLLRDVFGCDRLLAFGLGLLYTLLARYAATESAWQGFAIWDGLALPALPLIPWLIWRSGKWRAYWAYPVAVAAGFLYAWTSHFFLASFTLLVGAAVTVLLPRRGRRRPWLPLLVFLLGWLAGEGQVLWAAAVGAGASHRTSLAGPVPWSTSAVFTSRALRWLARTLAVPLALCAAGSIIALVRRKWRVLGLAAVVALILVATVEVPEFRRQVLPHVGMLSGFGWERISHPLAFAVIVTGGAGLALLPSGLPLPGCSWRRRRHAEVAPLRHTRLPYQSLLGAAVICFALVLSVQLLARFAQARATTPNYAALFERPEEKALARRIAAEDPARVVTVYAFLKSNHDRLLEPGYAWAYGLETADGYSNLYPESYKDFWEAVFYAKVGHTTQPIDYFRRGGSQVRLYLATYNLQKPEGVFAAYRWRMQLLSLANVRYLISPIRLRETPGRYPLIPLTLDKSGTHLVPQQLASGQLAAPAGPTPRGGETIYIYENPKAVSRAFLAGSLQVLPTQADVLLKMTSSGIPELSRSALVAQGDLPSGAAALRGATPKTGLSRPAGVVHLLRYSTDAVQVASVASKPSVLVFSMTYSPYWRGTLDGHSVKVMRTDYTFMGIVLTPGSHQVTLKYEPPQSAWPLP